jgi:hypothetical protein
MSSLFTNANYFRSMSGFQTGMRSRRCGRQAAYRRAAVTLSPRQVAATQADTAVLATFNGKFFCAKDGKGNSIDYAAVSGALELVSDAQALKTLEADYKKMSDDCILLGDAEPFADLTECCADLEQRANGAPRARGITRRKSDVG